MKLDSNWILHWFNKKKIKQKIKEQKRDACNGRKKKTATAKTVLNENININYNKTKKIVNYKNRNYA